MNRKTREDIAEKIARIAARHGAIAVDIDENGKSAMVTVTFEHVSCSMDIDSLHKGGILCSFYGASKPLRPVPSFDSINTCHYHKATLYRATAHAFLSAFEQACAAISDGSAFGEDNAQ